MRSLHGRHCAELRQREELCSVTKWCGHFRFNFHAAVSSTYSKNCRSVQVESVFQLTLWWKPGNQIAVNSPLGHPRRLVCAAFADTRQNAAMHRVRCREGLLSHPPSTTGCRLDRQARRDKAACECVLVCTSRARSC